MSFVTLVVFLLAAGLYFVPAAIASARGAKHSGGIMTINVLLGWTVLGWFAALIWACTDAAEKKPEPEPEPEYETIATPSRLLKSTEQRAFEAKNPTRRQWR